MPALLWALYEKCKGPFVRPERMLSYAPLHRSRCENSHTYLPYCAVPWYMPACHFVWISTGRSFPFPSPSIASYPHLKPHKQFRGDSYKCMGLNNPTADPLIDLFTCDRPLRKNCWCILFPFAPQMLHSCFVEIWTQTIRHVSRASFEHVVSLHGNSLLSCQHSPKHGAHPIPRSSASFHTYEFFIVARYEIGFVCPKAPA